MKKRIKRANESSLQSTFGSKQPEESMQNSPSCRSSFASAQDSALWDPLRKHMRDPLVGTVTLEQYLRRERTSQDATMGEEPSLQ